MSRGDRFASKSLQPVAEALRRFAVLAVVVLDVAVVPHERVVEVAGLDCVLDDAPAHRGARQILFPRVTEEGFQVLDRVALHAGNHGVFDCPIEINERSASEQLVELHFSRRETTHQALEGRGLVRGEVVDMRARIPLPRLGGDVDEPFESRPLFLERAGP